MSIPFESHFVSTPFLSLSFPNVLLLLLILAISMRVLLSRRTVHLDQGVIILGGLLLWGIAVTMIAKDPAGHIRELVSLTGGILFYFITRFAIQTEQELRWATKVLLGTVAFAGLASFIQFVGVQKGVMLGRVDFGLYFGLPFYRFSGTYKDPNAYGLFLLAGFPAMLYYIINSSSWRKRICSIILALPTLGGLIMSISRGAWLGAIASLVAIGVSRRLRTSRYRVVFFIITLCLGLSLGPIAYRWVTTPLIQVNPRSVAARLSLWTAGCNVLLHYPLGVGFEGWYKATDVPVLERHRELHNTFLQLATALGFPGLIIFILFYVWILRQAVINVRRASPELIHQYNALLFCLVAVAVSSTFLDVLFTKGMWLLAGLTSSLLYPPSVDHKEEREEEKERRSGPQSVVDP